MKKSMHYDAQDTRDTNWNAQYQNCESEVFYAEPKVVEEIQHFVLVYINYETLRNVVFPYIVCSNSAIKY